MRYVEGLVSVIMPTFRSADYIERAIDSILQQTYKNIECIIINDNTPNDDYSKALYKKIEKYFDDDKFVFLEQPFHINGAAARNYGIERARGEYIAFLDDDDWWKPEKIEKQVDFIRKQPPACGGVSTLVEYYENDKPIRWMRPYKDGRITKEILRRQVDVNTGSFMAKHEALDDAGVFDPKLKRHQEVQLLAFFSHKYEIKLLPEYLMCYNLSTNNNMPTSEKLRQFKEDFFKSVEPIFSTLSHSEVRRIKALHRFELAYIEYKERKYRQFLADAFSILRDPKTFCLALKRVKERKAEYTAPREQES